MSESVRSYASGSPQSQPGFHRPHSKHFGVLQLFALVMLIAPIATAQQPADYQQAVDKATQQYRGDVLPQDDAFSSHLDAHKDPNQAAQDAFIDAYRKAHDKRDIETLKKLSYLERVPPDDKTISDPRSYNFDEPIKNIQIVPTDVWPPKGGFDPAVFFVRDGIKYELNLPLVASLKIEYIPDKKRVVRSKSEMPLGFKDGRYWILTLVPVPK